MAAIRKRFLRTAGGRARGRAVFLLACVLALDTADIATIGAIGGKLESALSLSNTQLGLLVAIPALAAAVGTVPVGVLSDRINRVRLIAISVVLWGATMVASGLATSFGMLLLTRIALGAANATAGPPVASLVGDFFAPRERGRVYGLILSGELLGAGLGFMVSGVLAALSWRAAFFALAVPSLALGVVLWRLLPEPVRGGASRLPQGAAEFVTEDQAQPSPQRDSRQAANDESVAQQQVQKQHVSPNEDLVLDEDPGRMGLWAATRYVLRIPTNVLLIVSSALGYFYLTGVETFGVVYFTGEYGLAQSVASLLLVLVGAGALVGVLIGGRLADRLVAQGDINGRVVVAGVSAIATVALFLPALLVSSLVVAIAAVHAGRSGVRGSQPGARCSPAGHHAPPPVGSRRGCPDHAQAVDGRGRAAGIRFPGRHTGFWSRRELTPARLWRPGQRSGIEDHLFASAGDPSRKRDPHLESAGNLSVRRRHRGGVRARFHRILVNVPLLL